MTSFLENFSTFLRILRDSKCTKSIRYDGRTIQFTGLKLAGMGGTVEFTLAEFGTEIKKVVESVPETAQALDDHQFRVWELLTHPDLKKDTTPEERKMYRMALFGANNHMLVLRSTLNAAKQDPIGQRDNLSASLEDIRNFIKSLSQSPELKAEEQRKALSDAAAISLTSKSKTKRWSMEDPDGQIREANRYLEKRLMQIIGDGNLNAQLPRDRHPSISELVNILITHGVFPTEGRSREFAEVITSFDDRLAKGDHIAPQEFAESSYSIAVMWFETILDDIR